MQVLCKLSMTSNDVRCNVCGQGFLVYWERQATREEQDEVRQQVQLQLAEHHGTDDGPTAHPESAFNVPAWDGLAKFSCAALLGGAPEWAAS